MKTILMICCLALVINACVSNEISFSDNAEIDISKAKQTIEVKAERFSQSSGSLSIVSFICKSKSGKDFFALLNEEGKPFTEQNACSHPVSQALLQAGQSIIAVNRLGAGGSEGKEIIGDNISAETLVGFFDSLEERDNHISGLWAFEEASVLGFRLAKRLKISTLIIGNGIYDWEITLRDSKDAEFLAKLKGLVDQQDPAFAELRSIAWDFSGLPKNIFLYHTKPNLRISDTQASNFRSALAASEYTVKLLILADENANLSPEVHKSVIAQITGAITPSAAPVSTATKPAQP